MGENVLQKWEKKTHFVARANKQKKNRERENSFENERPEFDREKVGEEEKNGKILQTSERVCACVVYTPPCARKKVACLCKSEI